MSNRQETMTMVFNRECGVCSYYQSGKRNSVAELRLHSPREIMTSLMVAHIPKVIKIYENERKE